MKWVGQKDQCDSGIAALAMLTDRPYAEIMAWYAERRPDHNWAEQGLPVMNIEDFLVLHGFAYAHMYPGVLRRAEVSGRVHPTGEDAFRTTRTDGWPPAPWADRHLCLVGDHDGCRYAVMLRDGTVFDALSDTPKQLSDWTHVYNVWAICRIP